MNCINFFYGELVQGNIFSEKLYGFYSPEKEERERGKRKRKEKEERERETRPSALGMSDPIKDQLTVEPFE